jgi:hypothetical protein
MLCGYIIYLNKSTRYGYNFYFIFQNQYFNQMYIQGYINLKKYACFIILDVFQKKSYSKLGMFSNLSKFY